MDEKRWDIAILIWRAIKECLDETNSLDKAFAAGAAEMRRMIFENPQEASFVREGAYLLKGVLLEIARKEEDAKTGEEEV